MHKHLFAIGINHDSSQSLIPSIAAGDLNEIYDRLLTKSYIDSLMILQTCNRIEYYGIGDVEKVLIDFNEKFETQSENTFIFSGDNAIFHIFQVACGIKSQLIGDLEILGQFKKAISESREQCGINGYFEKFIGSCIKAAKYVRTTTNITNGTTSISYALIEYLRTQNLTKDKKILLVGTGDLGLSIARNIKYYLPNNILVLSNRTLEKAKKVALSIKSKTIDFKYINESAKKFDIIITAISGHSQNIFESNSQLINKHFIDLSVPSLISQDIQEKNTYISNKELSTIINKTLDKRRADLPKVHEIILKEAENFKEWSNFYDKSKTARSLKNKAIEKSSSCPFLNQMEPEFFNQYMNDMFSCYVQFIKNQDHSILSVADLPKEYVRQNKNSYAEIIDLLNNDAKNTSLQ